MDASPLEGERTSPAGASTAGPETVLPAALRRRYERCKIIACRKAERDCDATPGSAFPTSCSTFTRVRGILMLDAKRRPFPFQER